MTTRRLTPGNEAELDSFHERLKAAHAAAGVIQEDIYLGEFVRESNRIEGIHGQPSGREMRAHREFLRVGPSLEALELFVAKVQPGAVLRNKVGPEFNVVIRNGSGKVVHRPPPGGPEIERRLRKLLADRNLNAYQEHHLYETLHPFTDGNGRSGRVLWLYRMGGRSPIGFLQAWYYQSLQHGRER